MPRFSQELIVVVVAIVLAVAGLLSLDPSDHAPPSGQRHRIGSDVVPPVLQYGVILVMLSLFTAFGAQLIWVGGGIRSSRPKEAQTDAGTADTTWIASMPIRPGEVLEIWAYVSDASRLKPRLGCVLGHQASDSTEPGMASTELVIRPWNARFRDGVRGLRPPSTFLRPTKRGARYWLGVRALHPGSEAITVVVRYAATFSLRQWIRSRKQQSATEAPDTG